jgi:hypothetical protein
MHQSTDPRGSRRATAHSSPRDVAAAIEAEALSRLTADVARGRLAGPRRIPGGNTP